jgi:hypothetical protein
MANQDLNMKITAKDSTRAAFNSVRNNVRSVQSPLQNLTNRFALFGRRVGKVNEGISKSLFNLKTAIGGVFAGMAIREGVEQFNGAAESIDEMYKAAQRAQMQFGKFQEYAYIAQKNDIQTEDLTNAFDQLARAAEEGARGSLQQSLAFRALRISGQELRRDSPDQLFRRVLEGVSKMPEGLKRASIMMDLFGRSGARLLPMIAEGTKGMDEEAARARQLGIIVGGDTAKAAVEYNDALKDLNFSITGIKYAILRDALPAIKQIVGEFTNWAIKNRTLIATDVNQFLQRLPSALKSVQEAAESVMGTFDKFSSAVGGVGNVIKILVGLFIGKTALSLVPALYLVGKSILGVFAAFGVAGTAVLPVLAAIGLLIAAGVLIYKNWDGIKGGAEALWETVTGAFHAGVSRVENTVKDLKDGVKTYLSELKTFWGKFWEELEAPFLNFYNFFDAKLDAIEDAASKVGQLLHISTPSPQTPAIQAAAPNPLQRPALAVNRATNPMQTQRPALSTPARVGVSADARRSVDFMAGLRAPAFGFMQSIPQPQRKQTAPAPQTITKTQNAHVIVDFQNAPRGMTARPSRDSAGILDLGMGYSNQFALTGGDF